MEAATYQEVQNLRREVARLQERRQEKQTERDLEDVRQELEEVKQELHSEKKKAIDAQMENTETKNQFDRKKERILEEIVSKDEELKRVHKQNRSLEHERTSLEKEIERLQQIIEKHQMSVCSMPLQQPTSHTHSHTHTSHSKTISTEVPPLDTSACLYSQPAPAHPPSNRSLNRCMSQQSVYAKAEGERRAGAGSGAGRFRGNSSGARSPPRSMTSMGPRAEMSPMQMEGSTCDGAFKRVKAQHLKLLKTCQLMVDAANSMECSVCSQCFPTEQFLEHISSSTCFLENYHSVQQPTAPLQRAQSQGLIRMSGIQGLEGATPNPLLFTPAAPPPEENTTHYP